MQWGIREVLMAMYGIVWSIVCIIIVWRTQDLRDIPNGLLAALGVGEGALLAAFRADEFASSRNGNGNVSRSDRQNQQAVEDKPA